MTSNKATQNKKWKEKTKKKEQKPKKVEWRGLKERKKKKSGKSERKEEGREKHEVGGRGWIGRRWGGKKNLTIESWGVWEKKI